MRLLLRLRGSFLPAGPVRLQGAVRRTGGRDLDFACHLRAVGRSPRSERSTYLQAARESIGTSRYRESHVAIRRMTDKASLYGNHLPFFILFCVFALEFLSGSPRVSRRGLDILLDFPSSTLNAVLNELSNMDFPVQGDVNRD